MSLIRMHNKKNDVTYIYESASFWDKEKGKPRSIRRLIGKINPETGEIILTGKRGRPRRELSPTEPEGPYTISLQESEVRARVVELEAEVRRQQEKIWHLEKQNTQLLRAISNIVAAAEEARKRHEASDAAFADRQAKQAEANAVALAEAATAAAQGLPVPSLLTENSILGGEEIREDEE